MKFKFALYAMLAIAFSLSSCGDDDEESCSEDEICSAEVTVCCTADDCKYVVDGTEYDSKEEAEANVEACSGGKAAPEDGRSVVSEAFDALTANAKANL